MLGKLFTLDGVHYRITSVMDAVVIAKCLSGRGRGCDRVLTHDKLPELRNPASARFWEWTNGGWVRITVRQGQTLERFQSCATDEGYSSGLNRWSLEGAEVIDELSDWGRDCDGGHESESIYTANVSQLEAVAADENPDAPRENAGIRRPQWTRISARQRDEYAEAAGY